MKKKILVLLVCVPFFMNAQSSYNLALIGEFDWNGLSYDSEGSDIWGWKNPTTGVEYALVGLNSGFSVLDLSSPQNPSEVFFIPGVNTTWRDIKTWGHYAYVINEGGDGLLIVDLTDLSGQTYVNHTTHFNTAHNIYIDENGVAYIFGSDIGNGGAIFLDVDANPMNPAYLGTWDDYYIHDGMCRGDTLWAGCIYEGEFYAVDVSDKTNPQILGHHVTPNQFTHNIWVSDDGKYVFTTDEQTDSYIGSYNVEDMNNIQEVDRIQSNPGSNSIPHNTHVDGNFLVTSWYRDGTTVHDATYPSNLIQVAYYDSYFGTGNGFDGCWGTYPYLPSGLIISSDINSASNGNGRLLIFERGFSQASYLEGNVKDANNLMNLSGVSVEILNTTIPNMSTTNLSGNYVSGTANPNTYDIVFSKAGYLNDTINASLVAGVITIVDALLVPLTPFTANGMVIDINGSPVPNADILIYNNDFNYTLNADNNGNFSINNMFEASYEVIAGQWGYITSCNNEYIDGTNNIVITLNQGYYDDFTFDFGWTVSGGITSSDPGRWERGDPEGTLDQGLNYNPENDINSDCFEYAYVTGINAGSSVGSNDVDDYNTVLTSPIFDLSQPLSQNQSYYLSYYCWFSNGGGGWQAGSPNDSLTISITNGNSTVVLETITENDPMGQWNFQSFELSQYLPITSTMQVIVETADWDALGGHLVESGFDKFQITSTIPTNVPDLFVEGNRKLVKIVDILGREVDPSKNIILFYIYDDGTLEKRIIIE